MRPIQYVERFNDWSVRQYDGAEFVLDGKRYHGCLLYTSPSPRDAHESRMPSSA